MMLYAAVRIDEAKGQAPHEAHRQHAMQHGADLLKPRIQTVSAHIETEHKQPQHLEVAVAVDKLRHPLEGSLHEEL